jgi:hypothetical protein
MDPGLIIPIIALCIPIVAIVGSYWHKVEEMRLKAGLTGDANVTSQLREIQNQIAELRDTTTRYDMSFDSALQRIESRVGSLESRVTGLEHGEAAVQTAGKASTN